VWTVPLHGLGTPFLANNWAMVANVGPFASSGVGPLQFRNFSSAGVWCEPSGTAETVEDGFTVQFGAHLKNTLYVLYN